MTMKSYRKKPVVIQAAQWFKHGDYDESIVARNPMPDKYMSDPCNNKNCRREMRAHGWIKTLEGGHTVCPGDWIITGVQGEHYPCKPDIFAATYDEVAS